MNFKENQTTQKLRGGYYTPQFLADFVTQWAIQKNPQFILEPSCGDGVFIQALHNNNCDKTANISCFELFDTEVQKSINLSNQLNFKNLHVTEGDFLTWANKKIKHKESLFDAVIGNPPFIRYQYLEKNFQEQAELVFKELEQKFTKHTNAWVPFILSAIALLRPNGRLAMIIPSEIIHVMHAQSLRSYMGTHCSKIVIIDPKEIWFEDTLQGAVILMAEKKETIDQTTEGVSILSVSGSNFTKQNPNEIFQNAKGINGETIKGKWSKALLSAQELLHISKIINHSSVHQFKDIATVDVGIVTGANDFFLVNNDIVEQYQLERYAYPMFGRSQHCPGIIYDVKQHQLNQSQGLPTNFLYIDEELDHLPERVQEYIQLGENQKLHERYKCRIRKPWYKVPSIYSTKIGMLKRCHEAPRLILNTLESYTTDTAYRITTEFTSAENLVCSFLNPLTAITAELEGRYYGGGVLELVPSEIEKLYIPIAESYQPDSSLLNQMIKDGNIEEALQLQGEAILKSLGFSKHDNELLMQIWIKLRDRRLRR